MGEDIRRQVAVIVPAMNEEERIGAVLRAIVGCKLANEIIVVDDGSSDATSSVAAKYPNVRVLRLSVNRGKGGAMLEGARATRAGILTFVDADLAGLRSDHVDRIIAPLLADECDMCVGIFRGGKVWSDAAQRVSPYLSGQRALRRELFEAVPFIGELRMGVEVALNLAARRRKARILRVVLRGVSNCYQEKKRGLVKGTTARLRMWGEIGQAVVKTRPRRRFRDRPSRWRWPHGP
jgi:glycosyltransferase involved in cell wall biosynthesis